jgi:O-antigen/teichoic acid export membrane protein
MLLSSGSTLLHRLLILALGLFAIWRKASAGVVASTFIVGAVFLMVVAWRQTARRFGTPRLRFAPTEALSLYRRAAPFFGLSALSVIYARGAAIALGALSVARAVGLYAVADRLMVAFGMVSGSFNSAVYPALTRVAHQAPAEARVLLARCLRLLLVAAIPVAALAAIFATDIVRLCFGPSYAGGGRALAVLAWTLPIRGAQALLGSQLAAMNQQAALARARAVGLALFAVAAPLLIWRLSYVGAAWAVLLCDSVQTVLYWLLLKRIAAAPALAPSVLGPAAAAAVTMAASVLFGPLPLMLRVVAAVVVMAAGLWGFGAIKLHDLRFLRALIVGRSRSAPI